MAKPDRVLSMLGIAKKARKLASGEFQTEQAIKKGEACYVILATDASENTKKKFRNMCTYRQISYAFYGTKEEIGHAIGTEERSSAAITDAGIAAATVNCLKVGGNVNGENESP